jgi:hypothetical protein
MILEAFGGISPHSLVHFIRRLALRAKGARARDSTVYGGSSTSAKSFFVHHTQQLAAAAQVGDAKGIRKKNITDQMKMRLIKVDALKATGRGSAISGPARRLIEYGCDNRGSGGPPELMVTASVCTPVRCLGCRIINIGCETHKRCGGAAREVLC